MRYISLEGLNILIILISIAIIGTIQYLDKCIRLQTILNVIKKYTE